jgi:hypothetical protein
VFAFLGNFVGAAVFVSGFYYYLYGRNPAPDEEPAPVGNGRTARETTVSST